MLCPNDDCGEELEREDTRQQNSFDTRDGYRLAADYWCNGCGLTAHWVKDGGLTIAFDPRTQKYAGEED